jgi:hypothetical protein
MEKSKLSIFIRSSYLFDIKSILFCLTRYVIEKYNLNIQLKQSYLNSLVFETLDEYIDIIFSACDLNDKTREEIQTIITSNDLYQTVKPRLLFTYNIIHLMKLISGYNPEIHILYDDYDKFIYPKYLNKDKGIFKHLIYTCNGMDVVIEELGKDSHIFKNNLEGLLVLGDNKVFNLRSEYKQDNHALVSNYEEFFTDIFNKLGFNADDHMKNYKDSIDFIYKFTGVQDFKLLSIWDNYLTLNTSIKITSTVVKGFQRGSKMLGVPTANLEINDTNKAIVNEHYNGVYFGLLEFKSKILNNHIKTNHPYKSVLSIGYNPYFDNLVKTIEVYLIDYNGDDFYGEEAELTITGYLRSESSFETFSELVTAIGYDITVSNNILNKLI